MSGTSVVLDTNVCLYLLKGDRQLAAMLEQRPLRISQITRMELLSYSGITKDELKRVQVFLESWPVEPIHPAIEDLAIHIRREYRFKLPDSIIAATACHLDIPLLTADHRLEKLVPEVQVVRYDPASE
ncbi:MAG: type II toxin-antitoxin system VapC family toxin [Flavobacteriales bacterium]|nr:type II toxin-antitoxin system VapC family toxin [Flavobacteriales bacterium]MCC6939471.1 type II toxin-antitoxin system VapC family toxin [Flavobacteriales bacterium]